MAGKESARGPTSDTVKANTSAARESQNLNYTQVSDRLTRAGWPISAVGVRRIESGERRIDVDDLVALAVALKVSPITLLMPTHLTPDDSVLATAVGDLPADELFAWLRGDAPLPDDAGPAPRSWALPQWFIEQQDALVTNSVRSQSELVRLQDELAWLNERLADKDVTIAAQAQLIEKLQARGDD